MICQQYKKGQRVLVTLVLVPFLAAATANGPDPREIQAHVRTEATRWLRARQSVILACDGCEGAGAVTRPTIGTNGGLQGLVFVEKRCGQCQGFGVVVRPAALRDLYRPYLPKAKSLPGVGEARLSEKEIRAIITEDGEPKAKRQRLEKELGLIRGSAQVKKVVLEAASGEILFAKVICTVDPVETTWVRVKGRWHLVGAEDEETLRGGAPAAPGQEQPASSPAGEGADIGS